MSDAPSPSPSPSPIDRAIALLHAGEVVGVPTETVYGLAADAVNDRAVRQVFALKQRPPERAVSLLIAKAEQMPHWVGKVPEAVWRLAEAFWPGPLTLVLPAADHVLPRLTAGSGSIGLRVPDHPLTLALLTEFTSALAAPSANLSGGLSPTSAQQVTQVFADAVPLVLDGGACRLGIESTVMSLVGKVPCILRAGAIDSVHISDVLGQPVQLQRSAVGGEPGHLALTIRIVQPDELEAVVAAMTDDDRTRTAILSRRPVQTACCRWQQMPVSPAEYAYTLYQTLNRLYTEGMSLLLVEALPDSPQWQGLSSRLQRMALLAAPANERQ